MTTATACADGRRTKMANGGNRERRRDYGAAGSTELIETPALMVRDGTSRDEVDGAFKRVMASPI